MIPILLKIAHRGASGHYPENTLLAFGKALEMGANGFELDVHICASGEPVVIHDAALKRTTGAKGTVKSKTLAELKMLDAGKGQRIPTLAEVLALAAGKATVFIELKSEDSALPVAQMIHDHVAHKGWRYDELIPLSFNHALLQQVAEYDPHIPLCASFDTMPADLAAAATRIGAVAVAPNIDRLTPAFVADARARGLKIYTWTTNNTAQIEKARALNVDGIMGDWPEKL